MSSKAQTSTGILTSWKEIASHLGRGIRTAQRWEREFGLPVRRPHGKNNSTVMALTDEIDAWIRTFPGVVRSSAKHSCQPRDGVHDPTYTRVLLINDNEAQLYATRRMLSTIGYQVTSAKNGREALALASKEPDVILLDVNLPDIHGFELLRRLRQNPLTTTTPVIFLSATYTAEGAAGIALQLGAKAFLQHPLLQEQLRSVIESTLQG